MKFMSHCEYCSMPNLPRFQALWVKNMREKNLSKTVIYWKFFKKLSLWANFSKKDPEFKKNTQRKCVLNKEKTDLRHLKSTVGQSDKHQNILEKKRRKLKIAKNMNGGNQ